MSGAGLSLSSRRRVAVSPIAAARFTWRASADWLLMARGGASADTVDCSLSHTPAASTDSHSAPYATRVEELELREVEVRTVRVDVKRRVRTAQLENAAGGLRLATGSVDQQKRYKGLDADMGCERSLKMSGQRDRVR